MSELVRLYRYRGLLSGGRALSTDELMHQLEVSRATVKRDLAKLRDQLHVPIRHDRDRGGYFIEQGQAHSGTELPGLWFDEQELLALVTIQQLLSELAPGVLGPKLRPLRERLTELMTKHGLSEQDVSKRIRLAHVGGRKLKPQHFEAVAAATLARRRVWVKHYNRQNGTLLEREISPQRLVHYRDNWYVDAWCHLREDLRSFSVDAFAEARVLDVPAKEVTEKTLEATFGAAYGIFNGAPKHVAVLRFAPERARWVRREQWHPQQHSQEQADGGFVLSVPYADDRELLGDILRFGADVQVLEPQELKLKTQRALLEAAARYVGS